jgi:hypothetical protein
MYQKCEVVMAITSKIDVGINTARLRELANIAREEALQGGRPRFGRADVYGDTHLRSAIRLGVARRGLAA